jgi:hypothetical protein
MPFCMTWLHAPPACSHNPSRPCIRCGKPTGYRFTLDDGSASSPFKCVGCQRTEQVTTRASYRAALRHRQTLAQFDLVDMLVAKP